MEPKKNWHKKFKTPIFVWRTRDITPNEGERLKPWITNTWNSNNASNEQTDDSLSEMKRYQTNWNKNKFASHTAMAAAIKTDIRMLASKQKRKRTKQTDDYDDKRRNERHALCVRSIEMPISSLVFLLSVFLLGSCFQQKKKLVLWVNQRVTIRRRTINLWPSLRFGGDACVCMFVIIRRCHHFTMPIKVMTTITTRTELQTFFRPFRLTHSCDKSWCSKFVRAQFHCN